MSRICVLTEMQAEAHRKTGELPDHRHHRHVSRPMAERRVKDDEASWVGELRIAITMRLTLVEDPWRLALCRSGGRSGPVTVQLVR